MKKHILRFGLTLLITFVIGELAIRLFLAFVANESQFSKYASYRQLQNKYATQRLTSSRYLGYTTTPNYNHVLNKHDSLGFRGENVELPKPKGVYRIVCLGGSTTYSEGVNDYHESYPYLLEKNLRSSGWDNVQVINAGVPGYSSLETLINFQTRVRGLSPDMIVIYQNVNDLHSRLVWPPEFYKADRSGIYQPPKLFNAIPIWEYSALIRLTLVRLGLTDSHGSINQIIKLADTYIIDQDKLKKNGLANLNLREVLETNKAIFFKENIQSLTTLAQSLGIKVVLSTFIYSEEFPETNILFSNQAIRDAIEEQNEILRDISTNSGALLYDLAREVPADKEIFTDGIHFNQKGNEIRSKKIAEFLIQSNRQR
jgi:lysophospholipase L1-like esterase